MQATQIMIKMLGIARYRRKALKKQKKNEIRKIQKKSNINSKYKNLVFKLF